MQKNNLTQDDKIKLIDALNKGVEPSPDLLLKLFPGTAEKFDIHALDRAKIPTLEYSGKRSKAAILAEAGSGTGSAPLQKVRSFAETENDEWNNMIVQGDNLQFLKACYKNVDPLIKDKVKGKVKLIYIDPPFATKSDFEGRDGEKSYSDKIATAEFIEALRERLIYMREILDEDGSIFVHLDQKMSHYVKIILDEIFSNNFQNEVIWQSTASHNDAVKKYGKIYQNILWYFNSKQPNYYFDKVRTGISKSNLNEYSKLELMDGTVVLYKGNEDKEGRRFRTVDATWKGTSANKQFTWRGCRPRSNREWKYDLVGMEDALKRGELYLTNPNKGAIRCAKMYMDTNKGTLLQDIWVEAGRMSGGGSYPTQKPEPLLERIILSTTDKNDLIVDLFGGSGTTAVVAEKLGRRWIACDFGKHAIYTMQKRMLRISESKALEDELDNSGKVIVKKGNLYKKSPKPFCVVSSGAYDFTHVMDLRKHKETYIDFVLGLFQLSRDNDKAKKYKLTNIYAFKDSDPVEVYPVWNDQFLKEVKIDEDYLQGIIMQSGGRLKGDYFIITPESCTNVGDTTIKNQESKEVNFRILTFPYKVLEDISRTLELQEQPSSQDDVNNLITSTAFYFNDDVTLKAKFVDDGIHITKFETKIFNKEGKRFEGFSGIAMLLIDLNYEAGKPFDMDLTIFAKDISEDGLVKINNITKSVGIIAIDKHGNESKPVKVE